MWIDSLAEAASDLFFLSVFSSQLLSGCVSQVKHQMWAVYMYINSWREGRGVLLHSVHSLRSVMSSEWLVHESFHSLLLPILSDASDVFGGHEIHTRHSIMIGRKRGDLTQWQSVEVESLYSCDTSTDWKEFRYRSLYVFRTEMHQMMPKGVLRTFSLEKRSPFCWEEGKEAIG